MCSYKNLWNKTVNDDIDDIYPVEISITKNSSYINNENYVVAVRSYNIVIVSGRFHVTTEKPAGQQYYLYNQLPISAGNTVVAVPNNNGVSLLINSGGELTSNDKIGVGYYNISCAYVCII